MSKIDGTINRIKDQQVGSSTKKVLLVEGSDDELAFGAFLRKSFLVGNSIGLLLARARNKMCWIF